jgi:hypothetical protein
MMMGPDGPAGLSGLGLDHLWASARAHTGIGDFRSFRSSNLPHVEGIELSSPLWALWPMSRSFYQFAVTPDERRKFHNLL